MTELEVDLIARLRAGEPGSREVYADWLEEQGEAARAKLIRHQRETPKLHDASDHFLLRIFAAETELAWRIEVVRSPIANCGRPACPNDWIALASTEDPRRRRCTTCDDDVTFSVDGSPEPGKVAIDPVCSVCVTCRTCDTTWLGEQRCPACGDGLAPRDLHPQIIFNPPPPGTHVPERPHRVAHPACLVWLEPAGPDVGRRLDLPRSAMLGRDARCRIQVVEDQVSRQHARIFVEEGQWWILDVGSTNGTYVRDHRWRYDRCALEDSDRIQIGLASFVFLEAEDLDTRYAAELARLSLVSGSP